MIDIFYTSRATFVHATVNVSEACHIKAKHILSHPCGIPWKRPISQIAKNNSRRSIISSIYIIKVTGYSHIMHDREEEL